MKKNNKGFTLAELLIVVAIIAVLVAIAIPVFTTQLEKAREATDISNIRSLYAEVVAAGLADPANTHSGKVKMVQQIEGWVTEGNIANVDLKTQLNDIAKKDTEVTVEWTPASGTNPEKVTIGGVEAKINFGVT